MKHLRIFFEYLRGTFYSLPVQLLFLHFRRYQVLLVLWVLMFMVTAGAFMKSFGADALFLAPEYLGNVNALSAAIMGISIAVFIMCWNITTFILFSRHFTFLAATQFPFLKYCINNSVLPIGFLIFYIIKGYQYAHYKELVPNVEIIFIGAGFFIGLFLVLLISFFYFFRADRTILRRLEPLFNNATHAISHLQPEHSRGREASMIRTEWFVDSLFRVRRCRDVSHYSPTLMETIFKRHHFAAVVSVFVAYLFLILIGFFVDNKFFQLPAGASFVLFCAIVVGVLGAIVYFFQSWSLPAILLFILVLNGMYQARWLDPRNKAYGLNYNNREEFPSYTQVYVDSIANSPAPEADRQHMIKVLENWKRNQKEEKPLLVIVSTSGGGARSATFTMNVLQHLDSLTGGDMMKKTFLFTGASGGMMGATYFRELYRRSLSDTSVHLQSPAYVNNIADDLLNATFTSFITRDIFAPERSFTLDGYTYQRDRGLAFESALNYNTDGVLNRKLGDYADDEFNARLPLFIYHTVITRDGKMMTMSTQPLRFMMQSPVDTARQLSSADAIDYATFFAKQNPLNLRMLTVLRMQATFPVVLPNVWLPAQPWIDVMDGGLRDNYGVETSLRFMSHMKDWIKENTRGVLVVQIRDRQDGGWEHPYAYDDLAQNALKPFFLLQNNWYKMMEYFQKDMATFFLANAEFPVNYISFQYIPRKEETKAALSFHLTKQEKLDIAGSIFSPHNQEGFRRLLKEFSETSGTFHGTNN
ncbi:MAG: patatin-like phospholipase family protein [Flavisolibacter sp.]